MAYMINGDDTTLDVDATIGTFAESLGRDDIADAFVDYKFCAANGCQVLLGHHDAAPVHLDRSSIWDRISEQAERAVHQSTRPSSQRSQISPATRVTGRRCGVFCVMPGSSARSVP